MKGPLASGLCVTLLLLGPLIYALRSAPRTEISQITLAVSDVERSTQFFTQTLGFEMESANHLRIGSEHLVLLHLPSDRAPIRTAAANDPSFQHIAIVVSNMDAAFAKLQAAGVELVSPSPQTLPRSNLDAAGIRALYFRDLDGHFLELIEYPSFKGEPRWQDKSRLFLGIDHTAIGTHDAAKTAAIYRKERGFHLTGTSFNHGPEQSALTGVADARVHITSLRGAAGPGIELIEYEPTVAGNSANDWAIDIDARQSRFTLGLTTFRAHWTRYVAEASELGVFMLVTILGTLLTEHPASPLRRRIDSAIARRVIMGTIIGSTVICILMLPMFRASGAHFNPSVTLAMLAVGRVSPWDAAFYIPAQIIGGSLGVLAAATPFWRASSHEKVAFAATVPGPRGIALALVAEAVISFVLMATLLLVSRDPVNRPAVPFAAGALLLTYIIFEAPLSGMSMNPARSIASALFIRKWGTIWLYVVVPIPAMTLAALLFGKAI